MVPVLHMMLLDAAYVWFCVKKDDLASHTSSASSGLIHGGTVILNIMNFTGAQALHEREIYSIWLRI